MKPLLLEWFGRGGEVKAKKSIIRHLSGRSQFTAFKRCLVIENDQINTDFHQYFNEI